MIGAALPPWRLHLLPVTEVYVSEILSCETLPMYKNIFAILYSGLSVTLLFYIRLWVYARCCVFSSPDVALSHVWYVLAFSCSRCLQNRQLKFTVLFPILFSSSRRCVQCVISNVCQIDCDAALIPLSRTIRNFHQGCYNLTRQVRLVLTSGVFKRSSHFITSIHLRISF